ncbi:hypothetical protein IAT40_004246 [Kwoniella sp. CBS 6097]
MRHTVRVPSIRLDPPDDTTEYHASYPEGVPNGDLSDTSFGQRRIRRSRSSSDRARRHSSRHIHQPYARSQHQSPSARHPHLYTQGHYPPTLPRIPTVFGQLSDTELKLLTNEMQDSFHYGQPQPLFQAATIEDGLNEVPRIFINEADSNATGVPAPVYSMNTHTHLNFDSWGNPAEVPAQAYPPLHSQPSVTVTPPNTDNFNIAAPVSHCFMPSDSRSEAVTIRGDLAGDQHVGTAENSVYDMNPQMGPEMGPALNTWVHPAHTGAHACTQLSSQTFTPPRNTHVVNYAANVPLDNMHAGQLAQTDVPTNQGFDALTTSIYATDPQPCLALSTPTEGYPTNTGAQAATLFDSQKLTSSVNKNIFDAAVNMPPHYTAAQPSNVLVLEADVAIDQEQLDAPVASVYGTDLQPGLVFNKWEYPTGARAHPYTQYNSHTPMPPWNTNHCNYAANTQLDDKLLAQLSEAEVTMNQEQLDAAIASIPGMNPQKGLALNTWEYPTDARAQAATLFNSRTLTPSGTADDLNDAANILPDYTLPEQLSDAMIFEADTELAPNTMGYPSDTGAQAYTQYESQPLMSPPDTDVFKDVASIPATVWDEQPNAAHLGPNQNPQRHQAIPAKEGQAQCPETSVPNSTLPESQKPASHSGPYSRKLSQAEANDVTSVLEKTRTWFNKRRRRHRGRIQTMDGNQRGEVSKLDQILQSLKDNDLSIPVHWRIDKTSVHSIGRGLETVCSGPEEAMLLTRTSKILTENAELYDCHEAINQLRYEQFSKSIKSGFGYGAHSLYRYADGLDEDRKRNTHDALDRAVETLDSLINDNKAPSLHERNNLESFLRFLDDKDTQSNFQAVSQVKKVRTWLKYISRNNEDQAPSA